ncbi:MAG: adenylyltransferase/cytidyltransferase family protein [Alphaproteobacteria bacterium]
MSITPQFNQNPALAPLLQWKEQGYTDIVLFGRFQPLHKGHMALLETLRQSGLTVNLVLNNKVDDRAGERNPFSADQRKEMVNLALPWLEEQNLFTANVYLGGGGDVGNAVRRLSDIFDEIVTPEICCADDFDQDSLLGTKNRKLVFAYFEKDEDRKTYLVDGKTITGVHYVELVGQPYGKFPIQQITEPMINAVGQYLPIDAKMFRNSGDDLDSLNWDLLDSAVAQYVRQELMLARVNSRPVGADQSRDIFTIEDNLAQLVGSPAFHRQKVLYKLPLRPSL